MTSQANTICRRHIAAMLRQGSTLTTDGVTSGLSEQHGASQGNLSCSRPVTGSTTSGSRHQSDPRVTTTSATSAMSTPIPSPMPTERCPLCSPTREMRTSLGRPTPTSMQESSSASCPEPSPEASNTSSVRPRTCSSRSLWLLQWDTLRTMPMWVTCATAV